MSIKTIISLLLGLGFLYALFTVGFPFLLAIVTAIALEPVVLVFMRSLKMNRLAASTLACSIFTFGIIGIAYLIGLKIVTEFIDFSKKVPDYLQGVNDYLQDTITKTKVFYDTLPEDTAKQLTAGIENLISSLSNLLSGATGTLLNLAKTIPNFFIVFIVYLCALYLFSFGMPTVKQQFLSLFDGRSRGKVDEVLQNLRGAIFGFFRAQIMISALTYVVVLLGLLFLHVNYAMAIALLIIIVDILPILGTGSFICPWAAYVILQGDVPLGIGLLVLFIVITVFRRIIEPKILGDSVGIGSLSALISLYVGFKIAGMAGLFLGPIVIIIYQAMRRVGLLNFKINLE